MHLPSQVRAFETQLSSRASLYASMRNVSLYWTQPFAQLIVEERADFGGMVHAYSAPASSQGAGAAGADGGAEPARPKVAALRTSLRKRIDHLMRLDVRSVERLYARPEPGPEPESIAIQHRSTRLLIVARWF